MPISVDYMCASAERTLHRSIERLAGPVKLSSLDAGMIGIRNIRFPLPIRVDVETGACEVSMRGFTRTVRCGESRLIPALEEVSLTLLRQARVTLTILPESGRGQDRGAFNLSVDDLRERKPATAGISLAVFASPQLDWGLSSAAACLGKLDGRWLSRKLLQECSSLRQLVRAQRLSRFVFDILSSAAKSSAVSYGFSDRCRLENAVYDQFGISVAALSRLSSARRRMKDG
ncbi:hypothetical protein [Cupriavidus lacunae]|nr:hypothetical protein [Cupriavidus lacunae]